MQCMTTERCRKKCLPHFTFLFQNLLATLNQRMVINSEKHFKKRLCYALKKWKQRLIIKRLTLDGQKRILASLATSKRKFLSVCSTHTALDAEFVIRMKKIIRGTVVDFI